MSEFPDEAGRNGAGRTDPLKRHRFVVDADGVPTTGFAEVRGLEAAVDDRPGQDSGADSDGLWNWRRRIRRVTGFRLGRRNVARTSPNLELRRGVTEEPVLWTWLQEWTAGSARPRDVIVYLLDDVGEPAVGWVCSAARPVKWTGPTLRADRPDVAVETLELTHTGIQELELPRHDE